MFPVACIPKPRPKRGKINGPRPVGSPVRLTDPHREPMDQGRPLGGGRVAPPPAQGERGTSAAPPRVRSAEERLRCPRRRETAPVWPLPGLARAPPAAPSAAIRPGGPGRGRGAPARSGPAPAGGKAPRPSAAAQAARRGWGGGRRDPLRRGYCRAALGVEPVSAAGAGRRWYSRLPEPPDLAKTSGPFPAPDARDVGKVHPLNDKRTGRIRMHECQLLAPLVTLMTKWSIPPPPPPPPALGPRGSPSEPAAAVLHARRAPQDRGREPRPTPRPSPPPGRDAGARRRGAVRGARSPLSWPRGDVRDVTCKSLNECDLRVWARTSKDGSLHPRLGPNKVRTRE